MPNLSRRHLVTTAAALPALAVPALASDATGPNHPDADLIALGIAFDEVAGRINGVFRQSELERAAGRSGHEVEDEREPELDALHAEIKPIENAITRAVATTMEGLMVKARVVYWCRQGEVDVSNDDATDDRVDASIIRDLMFLQGQPRWTAIPTTRKL